MTDRVMEQFNQQTQLINFPYYKLANSTVKYIKHEDAQLLRNASGNRQPV